MADFHEEMDRFQGFMPAWADRNLKRLRHPKAVWVRVPAGIAFTGGGVLSVLPGLGIWMLPVGLALLAHDVPVMQPPLARVLRYTNIKIEQRRARRKEAAAKRAAAKPAPKPAAKSAPQAAAKAAPEPVTKPAAKIATKTAAKKAPKSAPKAAPKSAARTAAKPAAKPAAKTAAKTAPKPRPTP